MVQLRRKRGQPQVTQPAKCLLQSLFQDDRLIDMCTWGRSEPTISLINNQVE